MAQAKRGDTVRLFYTGTLNDGTIFDLSSDEEPLEFTIGGDQVIPDFEDAVVGMSPGDSKKFSIVADRAYGTHDPRLVFKVASDRFPPGVTPEVGQVFTVERQDGAPMRVSVVSIDVDGVSLDANHPLAGQDLTFAIELSEIV